MYAKWLVKRGKLLNFACSKVNLTLVPNHTRLIDTSTSTHISVIMQGCLRSCYQLMLKDFNYVGDGNKAPIEVVGLFILQLESDYYLDLHETFYVPSFRQNLILFLVWTNSIILIHLEMESLVYFNIQLLLVPTLYLIIYINWISCLANY